MGAGIKGSMVEGTELKESNFIFFSCPKCGNKGEVVEEVYPYVNDFGVFLLKCGKCNETFFFSLKNPDESSLKEGKFELVKKLDICLDKDEVKKICCNFKPAKNLLNISGKERIPFLKGAWKVLPNFQLTSAELFCCPYCKFGIEQAICEDVSSNIEDINDEYRECYNWFCKGRCNPKYVVFYSYVFCPHCGQKVDYIAYSNFNGRGEDYTPKKFLIADVKIDSSFFKIEINGLFQRKYCKAILEKLILRWNLLAKKILIVSPFIGFSRSYYQENEEYFLQLLEWLMTITDETKSILILREKEYEKIRQLMEDNFSKQMCRRGLFELLEFYDLLNPLISGIQKTKPCFHAKFYAGIIPY